MKSLGLFHEIHQVLLLLLTSTAHLLQDVINFCLKCLGGAKLLLQTVVFHQVFEDLFYLLSVISFGADFFHFLFLTFLGCGLLNSGGRDELRIQVLSEG
jgi:hypothetical protein